MEIILPDDEQGPLYRVLYRHIRGLIQAGILENGTKLPSIRSLREQTTLSKTTIETAYHMLLEEGYIISRPRAGLFVIQAPSSSIAADSSREYSLVKQAPAHRHAGPLPVQKERVIDFSLLAVDGASFPIRAWKSVLHDALNINSSSIHQYGDPRGELGLRMHLSHYLKQSRGVNCLPEQIVIGSGLSYSIQILSKLLDGVTSIAVEQAGIAQVRTIFQQHNLQVTPIPMDHNELITQKLESKSIRAIYVTPTHRPIGNPLSYSIRQQLLHWASCKIGYIIEDDYDGEFRYTGKTIPSLQSLDQQGTVIYIGTFSKAFTPALRMNYMVLPIQLMNKLQSLEYALASPSRIDQWAMQLFMERGHWSRHIRRVRQIYRKKLAKLMFCIEKYLSSYVQVSNVSAGLHAEITVKTKASTAELIKLAAAEDVHVYAPQDLSSLEGSYPKLYIGFGGVTEAEIEQGIRLLAKAWSNPEVISG
ncbi:hypothetical protein BK133_04345 [Paenibacillus sp. FSL H8-0548]|uniref:MocR-like pyridoxine biosynthesis transcription factor PdxR n=1 Tax=Paenibacillus sp. FSL H8-0548 TaxID=1920422 RepID=UPI00096DEB85|nr:PLP-dependent aminotransferase family protein [Paenibacillus sp. FSL H8-0548]OMF37772.1 hypothetical protein BK133_04345 [Paenibacillus sp. FSL H8-0548]